jgi:hypothetical protein
MEALSSSDASVLTRATGCNFPEDAVLNRLTDGGDDASLTSRPRSTPKNHFLVLMSVRVYVKRRTTMRMEGFSKLKTKSMTTTGVELQTLRFVAVGNEM